MENNDKNNENSITQEESEISKDEDLQVNNEQLRHAIADFINDSYNNPYKSNNPNLDKKRMSTFKILMIILVIVICVPLLILGFGFLLLMIKGIDFPVL